MPLKYYGIRGLFFFLILLVFFGASCRPDRDRTDVHRLVIPAENDIQTISPLILSDPHTTRIVWQMYEGLLGLDEDGNPVPVIAESWEANDDFTEWTFHIRPDIYFHTSTLFDGPDHTRSVTARDVERSYESFAKGFGSFVFTEIVEGFDAFIQNETDDISGFEAVDEMTFRIHLTRPDPSFIYRITSPYLSVMPKEALLQPDEIGQSINVGTGPFKFNRRAATEVHLDRNPDYWAQTDGNIGQLVFRVEKSQQLRLTQFRNRQYSLMQLPVALIPEFFSGEGLKPEFADRFATYGATTFNIHYMGINNEAIQDVHLRRAMAHAIDKETIVDKLLYSKARVASSPVLPGMQGYEPPRGPVFDTDAAVEELGRSSYNGEAITLFVSDAPNSEQIGQVIQSDLGKIGINIRLQKLDFNSLITRLLSDDRPELFLMFSEWVYSAPEFILDSYNSEMFPNPNLFAYENSQVDELIGRLSELTSREDINRTNYKIEQIALQEVPAVWLYHQDNVYMMQSGLSGFTVNQHNHWNLADVLLTEPG